MKTRTFRPDMKIEIEHRGTSARQDISDHVIAVETGRQYGHAAGGWSISTTWALSGLLESLQADDFVRISLDAGDGTGLVPVMFGLVSRVAEVIRVDQAGKPSRFVKIAGPDLGGILLHHSTSQDLADVARYPGDSRENRIAQFLRYTGRMPTMETPDSLVRALAEVLLFSRVPWTKERISLERVSCGDTWQTDGLAALGTDGSAWDVLKQAANEPANVLSCDTFLDGRFGLILEQAPFHPETGKLTRSALHRILEEDIVESDLGRDAAELVNFVLPRPLLHNHSREGQNQGGIELLYYDGGVPQLDEASIKLHGFRPWMPASEFGPFGVRPLDDAARTPDVLAEIIRRAKTLWNWHRKSHLFRCGNLTIKGRPAIRAGDGILAPDGREYFVETVGHSFRWGVSFTTRLGLTRGQQHA